MILDRLLDRILPETGKGVVDYWLRRVPRDPWGGPFNGQLKRRQMFDAIMTVMRPDLIMETGTFRGSTTELLAAQGAPVVSIEADERAFGFARARLRKFSNVEVILGDTRSVLPRLCDRYVRSSRDLRVFAYLDAHWNINLPLKEEVAAIASAFPLAVMMIDDFQVLSDPGYTFDDYGSGMALTSGYLQDCLAAFGLQQFYPAAPSISETGARRGCVVLAGAAVVSSHPVGSGRASWRDLVQVSQTPSQGLTGSAVLRQIECLEMVQ
jgi:hypothetical protein